MQFVYGSLHGFTIKYNGHIAPFKSHIKCNSVTVLLLLSVAEINGGNNSKKLADHFLKMGHFVGY